jgi:hypothetical protein
MNFFFHCDSKEENFPAKEHSEQFLTAKVDEVATRPARKEIMG